MFLGFWNIRPQKRKKKKKKNRTLYKGSRKIKTQILNLRLWTDQLTLRVELMKDRLTGVLK